MTCLGKANAQSVHHVGFSRYIMSPHLATHHAEPREVLFLLDKPFLQCYNISMRRYLRHLHSKGFTLVELVVVIAIMAILAASVSIAITSVARSVTETNNKTSVRSYFTMAKTAMKQINSGVSIYSNGTFTTNADISTLLQRTTGKAPVAVYRLEDSQDVNKYAPFVTDKEGYYVVIRFADPKLTYPQTSSSAVESSDREFFVDGVFLVSDKACYAYTRATSEVQVSH